MNWKSFATGGLSDAVKRDDPKAVWGSLLAPGIGQNASRIDGEHTLDEAAKAEVIRSDHEQFIVDHPGQVDPNYSSAAVRMGEIEKQDWNDYKTRFIPIENALMQQTTYMNPALAGQEIGKAESDTAHTFNNIAGSSAIQLGRYGMSMTADQQASSDRLNSLGKSGAVVDAANNIRLKLVERNQQIASGSSAAMGAGLK